MLQVPVRKGSARIGMQPNRFIAFKLRPNEDKDDFVHGLTLADLEDRTRFPLGEQSDEKGVFVWGSGINEVQEA